MNKCLECGGECDFNDYDCKHCGEKFWTSKEAYEKNFLKIKNRKVNKKEEYYIDRETDETVICSNCKKETIVSTCRNTFAGMVKKKYVCDHCSHFLGGDPKKMRNTGILEILGGLLSFGFLMLVSIGTGRVGGIVGNAFGIAGIVFIGDGLRRLLAVSKALKKEKNKK